jgi:2-polyprenyl-3-methyl-5-hydroxy-6-metoxy-1,4-benzoquinol methylase
MKRVSPQPDWPPSWRSSHEYDLLEIYGGRAHLGYAHSYARRRACTLELVRRAAPPGAHVLDLAAAQGNFTLALAELGYEVTWNDLRAELAGYVALKHERGTVHYLPGNIFELGCEGRFDVALITEVIEHVAHPDEFLARVARLVRPGGHVVMSTPNGQYLRHRLPKFSECDDPARYESVQFRPNADGHIFLLHDDEIGPLARQAGLRVVESWLVTNPLTFGHLKTEVLLRVLPDGCVRAGERITGWLTRAWQRRLHACFVVRFQRLEDAAPAAGD